MEIIASAWAMELYTHIVDDPLLLLQEHAIHIPSVPTRIFLCIFWPIGL